MRESQTTLVALLRFYIKILASKQLFFLGFFLKEPLLTTLSEISALISRKMCFYKCLNLSDTSQKHNLLWSYSFVFTYEK